LPCAITRPARTAPIGRRPTGPYDGVAVMTDRAHLPPRRFAGVFFAAAWALTGCAGPGPELFPPAPLRVETGDGVESRYYDLNEDGKPEYAERLDDSGRVSQLLFDEDEDGAFELTIDRLHSARGGAGGRHLIVIVDSVPYGMVRDAWGGGRFRLFYPPSPVIAPFPAMTDLSMAEFFGTSPSLGVEAEYYDGKSLNDAYGAYAGEGVAGSWTRFTDYHLVPLAHVAAYLRPEPWWGHELGRIQRRFFRSEEPVFIGYVVTTSAIGSHFGRNGHAAALVRLDRFCQAVMHRLKGRVQITLLSDHGHYMKPSRRIDLEKLLTGCGFRPSGRLRSPRDVVIPMFGLVSYAGIYTNRPADVARDVVHFEGIDLAMYLRDDDVIVILDRDGRATIESDGTGYRYTALRGDPLKLTEIFASLPADGDGFVDDRLLLAATAGHEYADAVDRLWRAFHGLMTHTPDVIVSVGDGWHCGSPLQDSLLTMKATHGNLGPPSSTAFVMTTAGRLSGVTRMKDLAGALRGLGVPVRGDGDESENTGPADGDSVDASSGSAASPVAAGVRR